MIIREGQNVTEKHKLFQRTRDLIPSTIVRQIGANNGRCVSLASSKSKSSLRRSYRERLNVRIPVTGVLDTQGKSVTIFACVTYHSI